MHDVYFYGIVDRKCMFEDNFQFHATAQLTIPATPSTYTATVRKISPPDFLFQNDRHFYAFLSSLIEQFHRHLSISTTIYLPRYSCAIYHLKPSFNTAFLSRFSWTILLPFIQFNHYITAVQFTI